MRALEHTQPYSVGVVEDMGPPQNDDCRGASTRSSRSVADSLWKWSTR